MIRIMPTGMTRCPVGGGVSCLELTVVCLVSDVCALGFLRRRSDCRHHVAVET